MMVFIMFLIVLIVGMSTTALFYAHQASALSDDLEHARTLNEDAESYECLYREYKEIVDSTRSAIENASNTIALQAESIRIQHDTINMLKAELGIE